MKHSEALRLAIDAGYTHGTSYYSYHPKNLKNMLREVLREEAEGYASATEWHFDAERAVITNTADSECHVLFRRECRSKKRAGADGRLLTATLANWLRSSGEWQNREGGDHVAELALTVKEAAELLGLSERTVYEMCYRCQIPFRRVHARGTGKQGKILISRQALEKWLAEGEPERKKQKLRLAKR